MTKTIVFSLLGPSLFPFQGIQTWIWLESKLDERKTLINAPIYITNYATFITAAKREEFVLEFKTRLSKW